MKAKKVMSIAAGLAIFCGLSIATAATTLMRMELPALAKSAELIVRARFIAGGTRWEYGAIWTFANFAVLETLKGSPPATILVRLPGGRGGHFEIRVEGVPHFKPGDETILFLERTSAGDYGITSWTQGTFRVSRNKNGTDARVTQESANSPVFDPRTRQFASVGIRNLTLEEFRMQIRAALDFGGKEQ
ncbi:MAG TPA: hypothetical protein VN862_05320 [Candidatus Acidoferrales bacterium]|jgi:hypothetical protein|nr:hypothetical protein [Candidatus Acidoferrales bacterium]